MMIYVCTALLETLGSSAWAWEGGLAGDQNGLFPTEIQAREGVGQERKVREQRKHETKG